MHSNDTWVEENLTYLSLTSTLGRRDTEVESQDTKYGRKATFFERIFRPSDVPAFEDNLRQQIAIEDEGFRFIRLYHLFNQKPLYTLMENIVWYGSFVADDSVQKATWFPEEAARQILKTKSSTWRTKRAEKVEKLPRGKSKLSFGDLLLKFSDTLMDVPRDCFQLCVLTDDVPSSHQAFSFNDKLKASLRKDYLEMCETPKQSVIYALKMHWKFNEDVLEEILAGVQEECEDEHFLPSKMSKRISTDVFKPTGDLNFCFKLSWFQRCPKYKGDLDIYVWQKYGEAPVPEYVKLFLSTGTESHLERAIALFKSSTSASQFRQLRSAMQDSRCVAKKTHDWAASFETAKTVVSLFRLVADNSEAFLLALRKQVKYLTYEGRKNPSGSKVQFLMHLNDCRVGAVKSLHENLQVLEDTKHSLERNSLLSANSQDGLQHELELCQTDLRALIEALDEAGVLILNLRKMIHEELNLSSMQLTGVLAILATLYVPLSFLSSLFGMNITPSSMGDSSPDISDLLSSNLAGNISPAELTTLLTYLTSQGNYMWDIQWYWILMLPLLLVSIVLPIFFGSLVRATLQSITRNRVYWRLVSVLAGAVYMVGIYGVLYNYSQDRISNQFIGNIYNVLAKGGYGFLSIWKLRSAVRRRRRRVVWCAWMVCVVGCTVTGFQGNGLKVHIGNGWSFSLWDVMPWIVLVCGCIWPGIMRMIGRLRIRMR